MRLDEFLSPFAMNVMCERVWWWWGNGKGGEWGGAFVGADVGKLGCILGLSWVYLAFLAPLPPSPLSCYLPPLSLAKALFSLLAICITNLLCALTYLCPPPPTLSPPSARSLSTPPPLSRLARARARSLSSPHPPAPPPSLMRFPLSPCPPTLLSPTDDPLIIASRLTKGSLTFGPSPHQVFFLFFFFNKNNEHSYKGDQSVAHPCTHTQPTHPPTHPHTHTPTHPHTQTHMQAATEGCVFMGLGLLITCPSIGTNSQKCFL
jgi:hypothetical protein